MKTALVLLSLAAAVAGCGGVEGKVADHFGKNVDCKKAGVMMVAGEQETVYACEDTKTFETMGCFAVVDGDLYDVSDNARALGAFGC